MTENVLTLVEWPNAKITFHQSQCKAPAQPHDWGALGGLWVMPQEQHNFSCRSMGLSLPQGGREGTFQALLGTGTCVL